MPYFTLEIWITKAQKQFFWNRLLTPFPAPSSAVILFVHAHAAPHSTRDVSALGRAKSGSVDMGAPSVWRAKSTWSAKSGTLPFPDSGGEIRPACVHKEAPNFAPSCAGARKGPSPRPSVPLTLRARSGGALKRGGGGGGWWGKNSRTKNGPKHFPHSKCPSFP